MSEAEHGVDFVEAVGDALESLPEDLRRFMSNVELVVEDEPPPGMSLLGLRQGPGARPPGRASTQPLLRRCSQ